jgi:serine/threonine-protein kinase RsbW
MVDFVAEVEAETDAISALTERASAFLVDAGVDARAAHHVALVLDELLTNVASHAGGDHSPATVRISISPDRIDAQVTDSGAGFDPRPPRNIDLSASVEDRAIGGLGLLLVHRVTDGLDYERIDDRNRTSFWIRRAAR